MAGKRFDNFIHIESMEKKINKKIKIYKKFEI